MPRLDVISHSSLPHTFMVRMALEILVQGLAESSSLMVFYAHTIGPQSPGSSVAHVPCHSPADIPLPYSAWGQLPLPMLGSCMGFFAYRCPLDSDFPEARDLLDFPPGVQQQGPWSWAKTLAHSEWAFRIVS